MNKTYIPTLFVLVLLAGLHFAAMAGHWYVRYPGFDVLMHIIGGVAIAFSVYWTLVTFFPQYSPTFWTLIFFTIAGGIAWEIFEGINEIAGAPLGTTKYYWDTAKDLVNDTLGAIIACYFVKK